MVTGDNRTVYLDASAIVKLVITEPESDALRKLLDGVGMLVTNRIAAVEVGRAVRRQTELDATDQVAATLQAMAIIELDAPLAEAAAALEPATLRTLDAIHLGSGLLIRDALAAFVTYDARLAAAAQAAGLPVSAPA